MGREGLQSYYQQKIEELEVVLREKEQNVRRLEAQRNEWNSKGMCGCFAIFDQFHGLWADAQCFVRGAVRFIKEELMRLQEPGSYVGEVIKVMGKNKVLVKVRI
jgi:26S proteasome regulatory subunit T6